MTWRALSATPYFPCCSSHRGESGSRSMPSDNTPESTSELNSSDRQPSSCQEGH